MNQLKKDKIKQTLKETKLRRKEQSCKSLEIKVDKSHLSKEKKDHLTKLFKEAKWLYNHILSQENVFDFDTKVKTVWIKTKEGFEERELKVLSSQMKQSVHKKIIDSIKGLGVLKNKGKKVGRLKFKSVVNSIELKQYKMTYQIISKNRIKIQGLSKSLKVIGLEQLPDKCEITTAKLVRRQKDFYLKIVVFVPKEARNFKEDFVGIDFGIKTSLTLSNGKKLDVKVPLTKQIRKAQKNLSRKKKGSKNRFKAIIEVQKQYSKLAFEKKDKRNKVVSYLTNTFKTICIQDENVKGWQQFKFGKQIFESSLGGIISDLKKQSETLILINRFVPTTKTCSNCGHVKEMMGLDERIYVCQLPKAKALGLYLKTYGYYR